MQSEAFHALFCNPATQPYSWRIIGRTTIETKIKETWMRIQI